MAKVVTMVYCEGIESIGDKNAIINPLPILTPLFVPGMFTFAISVGIVDFDKEKLHKLRIIFRHSENGKIGMDTNIIELPEEIIKIDQENDRQNIVLNMEFKNVVLEDEGMYETLIYFDEEEIGIYPISVKKGER